MKAPKGGAAASRRQSHAIHDPGPRHHQQRGRRAPWPRAASLVRRDGRLPRRNGPSRQGWRQRYQLDGSRELIDGPFAEAKELIAGYTLIQVRSLEEAQAWASRFPNPFPGQVCEIEVRQLYEEADFAPGGDMAIPLAKP
jgi:hypothetical protein